MDPKIALLFLLIGCVIGLSHLSDENLGRVRRQLADQALARIYATAAQSLGRPDRGAYTCAMFSIFPSRNTVSAAAVGWPCSSLSARAG